jgi:hypothetical protein
MRVEAIRRPPAKARSPRREAGAPPAPKGVSVTDGGPPDLVDDDYRMGGGADIIGIRTADFPIRLQASPFGRTILADGREVYARAT